MKIVDAFWGRAALALLTLVLLTAHSAAQDRAPGVATAPPGLEARLGKVAARAGGKVGVSVVHVESDRSAAVGGDAQLPLYSVIKLPIAVAVLKAVEAGRLRLDETVTVTPADVAPGASGNTRRWRDVPMSVTVRQLIEWAMVNSDNTASDKLLSMIGGPEALTREIRALGSSAIDIVAPTQKFESYREHPNRGSAAALTRFLSALQRGLILKQAQRAVLWDMMARSTTGIHRLRGSLPPGTPAIDKTGTGGDGRGTNDVGIVTLPGGRGHLAIAVLISDSKLPADEQERLIAELGRVAYDAYAPAQ